MANSTITIDNSELFNLIEEQIKRLEKPEPLLRMVGNYLKKETRRMFTGKRPDLVAVRGVKWDPLSPNTDNDKIRLRKRDPYKYYGAIIGPLVRTGKMMDSLNKRSSVVVRNKGLKYGTTVRNDRGQLYPAFHQLGSDKVNLPQRRFLFVTEEDLIYINLMTQDWVMLLLKKQEGAGE